MRADIQRELLELNEFVDQNGKLWSSKNQPTRLFHYTAPDGLIGIATTKTLWASDMLSLNDASEAAYAFSLIADVLDNHHPAVSADHRQRFQTQLTEYMFRMYTPFIVCFCEQGDLLSQWRAYGNGGEGFSIEFDFTWLTSLEPIGFRLQRVIYDRAQQEDLILMLLSKVSALIDRHSLSSEEEAEVWQGAAMSLAPWVVMFKDPSFQEECEWRLVNVPLMRASDYRRSGHRIVPYLKLKIADTSAITKVIQGPYFSGTEPRGIRYMMVSNGFVLGASICDSEIPLRK